MPAKRHSRWWRHPNKPADYCKTPRIFEDIWSQLRSCPLDNVGMKWCHGEIGWTGQSRVKCSLFQQSFFVIVIIWSRGWMETPRAAKHIASLQVYFGLSHDINVLCFGFSLLGMPRWFDNRFVFCCVNEHFCESFIERAKGSMIRSMSLDGLHMRSFSVHCFYSLFFQLSCAR